VLEALQTLMAGVFFYGEELYHYARTGAGIDSSARVKRQPTQVYKKDGKYRVDLNVNGLSCHSPLFESPKVCAARARVEIPRRASRGRPPQAIADEMLLERAKQAGAPRPTRLNEVGVDVRRRRGNHFLDAR